MSTGASPKFLQGSISGHLFRMTASGGLGLLALFAVDLVDLYFISLLGEKQLAAAVGFAGSILFFTQSISIGLSIAVGATASKAMGANDDEKAGELISSSIVVILIATGFTSLAVWLARDYLLALLGATGETLDHASTYLAIIIPTLPFMSIGMGMGGVMRARGDAKGAFWLTMSGAIVNAILDPILIFGLGLGLPGAAIASVFARFTMFAYGINKVMRVYKLYCIPNLDCLKRDMPEIFSIAVPSVLTNLSTPIGIAYVTATMAQYGDAAIAGNAVISRLQMVAFVGLFALSSVVGPIAGQNWGAKYYDRVRLVLIDSIKFVLYYCLIACIILAVASSFIVDAFQASEQSADLIRLFTYGLSTVFIFNGITFATNALFNNLGAAKVSTLFNFAKATIFTIPFVWLGSQWAGPEGILIGQSIGAVFVALIGFYWCWRHIQGLASSDAAKLMAL